MVDTILTRRSIRRFSERQVEDEKLQLLLRAAMQAPSAKNERPWEFLVIQNRQTLQALAQTDPYAGSIKNGELGIVLLCNKGKYLPQEDTFWQQDMSAAAQNLLLAAHGQGLGATWLAIAPIPERIEYASEVLRLPKGVIPFAMMPVGYPQSEKPADPRFDVDRVFYETYPQH